MHKAQQVVLIGALGLIIGALLPWITASGAFGIIMTKAGYEGDGIISGSIGILLLLGALLTKAKPGRRYSPAMSIFALIGGGIALLAIINISSVIANLEVDSSVFASVGAGLYVTIAGALLGLVGGLIHVSAEAD